MGFRVAADAVVVLHLAFLVFLATGSLLAWRRPGLVWLHVPALAWGLVSITVGLDCPLTPLEQGLRRQAGEQGYAGGFVDHYIEGVVYPERFTPLLRTLIGVLVVAGYLGLVQRARRSRLRTPGPGDARQRAMSAGVTSRRSVAS